MTGYSSIFEFYRDGFELMPTAPFAVVLFFISGMIGSFLNVCIWRIPRGESVVLPRSRCPNCSHGLGPLDLVPIVSWLASGGKCRYCKIPIALRYQWVELTNISLWMTSWAIFGRTLAFFKGGVAASAVLGTLGVMAMRRKLAREGVASTEAPDEAIATPPEEPAAEPATRRRQGFSFIEIVVSVGILGSIVTPFMLAIGNSYQNTGKNKEFIQAWNVAREKVEELRLIPVAKLKSDWDIYVANEDNIFENEFFGPYGRMKSSEEAFYNTFTDVWTDEDKLTASVQPRFNRNFKKYYGFDYELYPRNYSKFRRTTQVEDLTDPDHPTNLLKRVTVSVVIDSKATRAFPITLVAYMVNR